MIHSDASFPVVGGRSSSSASAAVMTSQAAEVYALNRGLYGLPQAGIDFNDEIFGERDNGEYRDEDGWDPVIFDDDYEMELVASMSGVSLGAPNAD